MIIILEGIDKTGKSTLAKKLMKEISAELIKVNKPKTNNPFEEYITMIKNLDKNKNYIFDRMYLGEMAYGPVFRGASGINIKQQYYIENLIKNYIHLLIYCSIDIIKIKNNIIKCNEETTKVCDVDDLHEFFNIAYERSHLNKIIYNYTRINDFKFLIETIDNLKKSRKKHVYDVSSHIKEPKCI